MIGNTIVLSFENELNIREYAEGCRITDILCGSSKNRGIKASVFFVVFIVMLFVIMINNYDPSRVPVAVIVILISAYLCTYYLYILPHKARLRGEHDFKTSRLISKKYRFDVYRDHVIMKNENEYIKRYNTDITYCLETDEIFVLTGGFEKRFLVISKRCLTDEQRDILSEHFQRELVKKYRSKVKKASASKRDDEHGK